MGENFKDCKEKGNLQKLSHVFSYCQMQYLFHQQV
jgi:hypothetical protein